MILSFKKDFIPKILDGTKIHTIRKDPSDRWKAGRKIHFATGVGTKNYKQFYEDVCISTQKIEIYPHDEITEMQVFIDNKELRFNGIMSLAFNDGFECLEDFHLWFNEDFYEKIIHWTKLKY